MTDDLKAEATEEKEVAVNGQAQIPESTEPAAAAVPQDKAEDKSSEKEAEKAAPIIAFITVAAAAFVLAAGKRNRILAILTAAVAAIAFFLTEDISLSLALVDRWTILMALILAVQAFMILKMGKENDESDAEKEAVLN